MPNRDQTGPKGEGPLTGRGMGSCPIEEEFLKRQEDKRKEILKNVDIDGVEIEQTDDEVVIRVEKNQT
ncbi:MAG: DUF5320 domain-containing protein [Elusimicrobiota bacterium]